MKGDRTIKPILHARITEDGRQYVKIRITQNGKSKFINLGFKIRSSEWNNNQRRVKSNCKDYQTLNKIIEDQLTKLTGINLLSSQQPNTTSALYTLVLEILKKRYSYESNNPDNYSSAKKIKTAINHFIEAGLSNVKLIDFTPEMAMRFDNFLRSKNNLQSSSIFAYHKVVRATLNNFCKLHHISRITWQDPYEFKFVETNRQSTPKFALKGHEIHTLEEYIIFHKTKHSQEFSSICMFLFSYYSLGMRFGDVYQLFWVNFLNGKLKLRSEKTNDFLLPMSINSKQTNILKYFSPIRDLYIYGEIEEFKIKEIEKWFPEVNELITLEREYLNFRVKHQPISQNSLLTELFGDIQIDLTLEPTQEEKDEFDIIIIRRDELLSKFIIKCASILKSPIFPFYNQLFSDKRKITHRKESSNAMVNKQLKKICNKFNIRTISFHHARHSFAHNARISKKFDIYQISRALNHSSLDITTAYLKSFEDTEIDEANAKWIKENMNSYYAI